MYANDRFGISQFVSSTGGLQFRRTPSTVTSLLAATGSACTANWHTHIELRPALTATITSTGRGTLP